MNILFNPGNRRGGAAPTSLYTADMSAFIAFNPAKQSSFFVAPAGVPYEVPAGRMWNGLSDRAIPSVQIPRGPSSKRTAGAPGSMSAGGIGVDVKHGSAARRLNRLKVQGGLRHNSAAVVSGCACPGTQLMPQLTCMPPVPQVAPEETPVAQVGAAVLARRSGQGAMVNAVIISIDNGGPLGSATVRFANGDTEVISVYDLIVLHNCCAALHTPTVDGPSILDNCCPVPPASLHDQIAARLKGGQAISGDMCRLISASVAHANS